ncbi:MAG: YncE family protein [Actinobacteria bacterium]|nr:YncE family protein [Actinomycetota bacterium]
MTWARLVAGLFTLSLWAAACAPGEVTEGADPGGKSPASPRATGVGSRQSPQPEQQARRNLVWVAVEGANRAVLVDLEAGEILESHDLPGPPHNITVAPDGTAATSLYGTVDLALIVDQQVRIATLGNRPHDVKATDRWFLVANEAGRRIDYVTFSGEAGPRVQLRGEPHDLAVQPGGSTAWVTMNGTEDLAVIDVEDGEVDRYVSTGHAPHDLLFSPDGRLWVTDWNGRLLVLDGDEVVDSRELGVEAHHLAFTPDGAEVWITDHGTAELFVVDTATLRLLDTIDLPGAPHHVAITPDGELAAVADHTNGELLVYRTDTRERVGAVAVGNRPHGVWAAGAS